jgi:hypothetical protein
MDLEGQIARYIQFDGLFFGHMVSYMTFFLVKDAPSFRVQPPVASNTLRTFRLRVSHGRTMLISLPKPVLHSSPWLFSGALFYCVPLPSRNDSLCADATEGYIGPGNSQNKVFHWICRHDRIKPCFRQTCKTHGGITATTEKTSLKKRLLPARILLLPARQKDRRHAHETRCGKRRNG